MTEKRRAGRPRQPVEREALLAVAREAFADLGYAGASMKEMAERAGIRKSSLFHHFASKEALYDAVFDQLLRDLGSLLPAREPGQTWAEQLDALDDAVIDYLGGHPESARLLIREIVGGGPVVGGPGWQAVLRVLEATAAFLQSGMDEGAIPPQDPRQLAMSIVGLHLTWYAASGVSGALTGQPVFGEDGLSARRAAVREQVRRLCGVAAS